MCRSRPRPRKPRPRTARQPERAGADQAREPAPVVKHNGTRPRGTSYRVSISSPAGGEGHRHGVRGSPGPARTEGPEVGPVAHWRPRRGRGDGGEGGPGDLVRCRDSREGAAAVGRGARPRRRTVPPARGSRPEPDQDGRRAPAATGGRTSRRKVRRRRVPSPGAYPREKPWLTGSRGWARRSGSPRPTPSVGCRGRGSPWRA